MRLSLLKVISHRLDLFVGLVRLIELDVKIGEEFHSILAAIFSLRLRVFAGYFLFPAETQRRKGKQKKLLVIFFIRHIDIVTDEFSF